MLFSRNPKKSLSPTRLLGRQGQKLCEKFLRAKGYKTLTRNFSCRTGEIDLVMMDSDGTVVFVEVKARTNENFADAEAAVTKAKQVRMTRAANLFIKKHKLENLPLRFDVVILITDGKTKPQIRHYENAF
ncbi:MAG: YraN family protein [Phycisphaerae bacterium]|nr:YraN family protein [Phycisphaerae bacterium]